MTEKTASCKILVQWEAEEYSGHEWVDIQRRAYDCFNKDEATSYRIAELLDDGTWEILEEVGDTSDLGFPESSET